MYRLAKWLIYLVLGYFLVLLLIHLNLPNDAIQVTVPSTNYYITANYFNSEEVLPYTFPEITQLIQRLNQGGNVYFSVFENGSTDRTPELLQEYAQQLLIPHSVVSWDKLKSAMTMLKKWKRMRNIIPQKRYEYMAALRNQALRPLLNGQVKFANPDLPVKIIFLNDIWFTTDQIIQLLNTQNGEYDIACPLDFYGVFYDVLATRDIEGYWFSGYYPFTRHVPSQQAVKEGKPFTVYSCWNGVAILNAEPFLEHDIRFRGRIYNPPEKQCECVQSECLLIATDYWRTGYNRIFVNPTIRLSYEWKYYKLHNMPIVTYLLDFYYSFYFELEGNTYNLEEPDQIGCSMPPYWKLENYTYYMSPNSCEIPYTHTLHDIEWTPETQETDHEFYNEIWQDFENRCYP